MEENVLIKSEKYDIKKILKKIFVVCLILFIIISIHTIIDRYRFYNNYYGTTHEHTATCYKSYYWDDFENDYLSNNLKEYKMECAQVVYDDAFSYTLSQYFSGLSICLIFVAIFIFIGAFTYFWLHSYELTVTNKRIFGKVAWGKRVDLPVDSISAISTVRILKGVCVSTSSGRISFRVIKNADEIYKVINNLLIERQKEKVNVIADATVTKIDEVEQIKKYKELLDSGIITQEEFDKKKKELLNL